VRLLEKYVGEPPVCRLVDRRRYACMLGKTGLFRGESQSREIVEVEMVGDGSKEGAHGKGYQADLKALSKVKQATGL